MNDGDCMPHAMFWLADEWLELLTQQLMFPHSAAVQIEFITQKWHEYIRNSLFRATSHRFYAHSWPDPRPVCIWTSLPLRHNGFIAQHKMPIKYCVKIVCLNLFKWMGMGVMSHLRFHNGSLTGISTKWRLMHGILAAFALSARGIYSADSPTDPVYSMMHWLTIWVIWFGIVEPPIIRQWRRLWITSGDWATSGISFPPKWKNF